LRIQVQLFATLSRYLPDGTTGDSVSLEVPGGATVTQVMGRLGIPVGLECLTVVDGRDAGGDHILREGQVLSIFPPLAGGG
jgi:molybdopterin converting factor small subunit